MTKIHAGLYKVFRIRIGRIRKFLGYGPQTEVGIRNPYPFIIKNDVLYLQKCNKQKNLKKLFFCWCLEGHRRKQQDSDPDLLVRSTYQHVKDPEHRLNITFLYVQA
jgi:hypothetical protein